MSGESNFLQALGWAVLNSLWQMALLSVIFQLSTAIFKLKKASQKSSLASVMLLSGFAWFLYTLISIFTSNTSNNIFVSSDLISVTGNEKLNSWLHYSLPIASTIYLILLILPVLHFIRDYRFVQLIRREGLSKMEVRWRIFVKKVAAQMGITRPVHIWVSELVKSPVTIGYLKPLILVPLAAMNHLTPQQLEAVLLHELSHIRRYDYIINLIINFIQTILYFNPFVKAFVKTVERERERSCDEMVLQFQYDPHGYASALLILEKANHFSRPLAIAASGKKNDLFQRIELILGINKKPFFSFNKLAGLFAGLLCVIALNALLIFSKPVNNNNGVSITDLSSPFYFFTSDKSPASTPVSIKKQIFTPVTTIKPSLVSSKKTNTTGTVLLSDEYKYNYSAPAPLIVKANFESPAEVPVLKNYQEAQIKEVMDASKKIMEERQWKAMEKNIADALTSNVKNQIKSEYLKKFNNLDFKKWEDKFRSAYHQLDWDHINEQLGKAVGEIRLDSLQKVYSNAVAQLNSLENQLIENKQKGMPDTDITLQSVEQKKELAKKVLSTIKLVRNKKIIHL